MNSHRENTVVIELQRFRHLAASRPKSFSRLFHPREIAAYGSNESHLAPRLAAKRALVRLAREAGAAPVQFNQIEVKRAAGGRPEIAAPKMMPQAKVFVSLSCDRNFAGAYVVLEQ